MEGAKGRIPFIVKIRTYLFHAVIVLIAAIVYIFLFQFLAQNVTYACSEIKRAGDAPHNEIIFSNVRTGEDSFYYLKQHHLVGMKNTNVSCDILMTAQDYSYEKNDIYFEGTLESGTCAVSENLVKGYGLKVGDSARISGTDKTFKVCRIITAQLGLDKEYKHDGIIILSYDESLLNRQYSFISFTTDGDEYPSLISLVFIEDWAKENINKVLIYAAVSVAAFVATLAVCEHFLFSSRRRDYLILASMGRRSKRLFADVFLENGLKYILPMIIISAIYSIGLSGFGAMYAIPVISFICVGILTLAVYSFFIIRKIYKCQVKTRR